MNHVYFFKKVYQNSKRSQNELLLFRGFKLLGINICCWIWRRSEFCLFFRLHLLLDNFHIRCMSVLWLLWLVILVVIDVELRNFWRVQLNLTWNLEWISVSNFRSKILYSFCIMFKCLTIFPAMLTDHTAFLSRSHEFSKTCGLPLMVSGCWTKPRQIIRPIVKPYAELVTYLKSTKWLILSKCSETVCKFLHYLPNIFTISVQSFPTTRP